MSELKRYLILFFGTCFVYYTAMFLSSSVWRHNRSLRDATMSPSSSSSTRLMVVTVPPRQTRPPPPPSQTPQPPISLSEENAYSRSLRGKLELDGEPWYLYLRNLSDPSPLSDSDVAANKAMNKLEQQGLVTNRSSVRIACLYVGFMRDFILMLETCSRVRRAKTCAISEHKKFFGDQRIRILQPLNCDVFISTWHIGGKGRYNIQYYDLTDVVSPEAIRPHYGPRLMALHVQNYSTYSTIWRRLAKIPRNFTEAYPTQRGDQSIFKMWKGVPKFRYFFRVNDYSQAYKHWRVLKLIEQFREMNNGAPAYDLYYRLRTDLRMVSSFSPVVRNGTTFIFTMTSDPQNHSVSDTRVHVHAPDISDFGYFGTPKVIAHLSLVWSDLCLADGVKMDPKHGQDERHASDYNRVVWQYIFQSRWGVDFGLTYLRISRRYKETLQSLSLKKRGINNY
eukprot:PhM_4_TR282/c0_g1_i1/m.80577